MPRRFNTAGPNDPEDHYTLPVLARLPDVRRLIDDKLYFVLHAPRQAGKTTALLTLGRELTAPRQPGRAAARAEGLQQIDGYLARLGLSSGWLVLFDRRPGAGPSPSGWRRSTQPRPGVGQRG